MPRDIRYVLKKPNGMYWGCCVDVYSPNEATNWPYSKCTPEHQTFEEAYHANPDWELVEL